MPRTNARATVEGTEVWTGLVAGAITHAISGLSMMVGSEIRTTYLSPKTMDPSRVHELTGGPEADTVAIHLGVAGDATGHILLLFQPATAFELIDLLMGRKVGTTNELGEMEVSVVAEMGNIMGAYFLSAIADTTGSDLRPSPPTVMMDMAAAVIDPAVADVMSQSDEILVVETRFGTTNPQIRRFRGSSLNIATGA